MTMQGVVVVARFPRLVMFISLVILCLLLFFFSNIDHRAIISLAVIGIFLIFFTFIFQIQMNPSLKVFLILFSFFALPMIILIYLGIFDIFWPWSGILALILVAVQGMLSIYTIIELNYVIIRWELE